METRSCGIDPGYFTPAPVPERGILFIGNLTRRKGFDLLIDAYKNIRNFTGEPLLLAGKNPENLCFAEDSGVHYLGRSRASGTARGDQTMQARRFAIEN